MIDARARIVIKVGDMIMIDVGAMIMIDARLDTI